jgi:hypothetical protein
VTIGVEGSGDVRVQLYTRRFLNPYDLRVEDVDILDIAHALALTNRFGGHTDVPYSVAEHSIAVAACATEDKLKALLHDAAEAYLGDICRPTKRRTEMAFFNEVERRTLAIIFERFGLTPELPAEIKRIDDAMLERERQAFMPSDPEIWRVPGAHLHLTVGYSVHRDLTMEWRDAERVFLNRFIQYGGTA